VSKLISQISNYPLSAGATAYSNPLLTNGSFRLKDQQLVDELNQMLELSKDINFFAEDASATNRWYDLLSQSSIFQLARFQSIAVAELYSFVQNLPQSNGFNANTTLSQAEHETLAYQKLQILQYLFWLYKTIVQTITDENQEQVQSILKSSQVQNLYHSFHSLAIESQQVPVLIKPANKKNVEAFKQIKFTALDSTLLAQLGVFYSFDTSTATQVLNIYSNTNDKIKATNEHAFGVFRGLMQVHQSFSHWSQSRIDTYAYQHNSHQPHIALLIAFAKMQLLFNERYNQLAHAHSNFIFQDILGLNRQKTLPDTAFVSIELAKNVSTHFLPRNSLFKAGKNLLGKTVYYQSNQDLVLNAAKIDKIASCVRLYRQGQLYAISATTNATLPEWQVNDAWLPFNDLSEAYTGLGFESNLLPYLTKKDCLLNVEVTFNKPLPTLPTDLADKIQVAVIQEDGEEILLSTQAVSNATAADTLTISAKIDKDLKTLKQGINARLKLISPAKTEQDGELFVVLYQYLLSEPIGKLKVKVNQNNFAPSNVKTTSGQIDGTTSFTAFGSASLAGSSFSIVHPFIRYAKVLDINLVWGETLTKKVAVTVNNETAELPTGDHSLLNNFENKNASQVRVKLTNDLTYKITSTIKGPGADKTIETSLPKILIIKEIELSAALEELVYEQEPPAIKFLQYYHNYYGIIKSLRLPFADKKRQKERVRERIKQIRMRYMREQRNNLTAHLYPLGQLLVYKDNGLTLLPNNNLLGYNSYEAELCIGLSNILPGQSLSLLFEIADETADQTEREAKISWFVMGQENFEALDSTKIVDTTANFLQSGLLQLTLPDSASNTCQLIYGTGQYWLLARCNTNYDVVANIKNIKVNGLAISRILDENNAEAKVTMPADTIENVYPKNTNIKSLSQNVASLYGRVAETDAHYWWRSSQRLRHKQRAVNQWDMEQLLLENFAHIYKVKCLNHAYFDAQSQSIIAKPAHTVLVLLPHYAGGNSGANLQPALQMSKLLAIKNFIASKTSAFYQLQVLNTQWDEVQITAQVVLAKGVIDLVYFREQLNQDLKKFIAPWAFETTGSIAAPQKIYLATLVDYIDELSYVHHIKVLTVLKNGIEVQNEIVASTPIHLITTAPDHAITVFEYAD
jgi:hypothetical protein